MACNLSQRQIYALTISLADEASWCCVFVLLTLLLLNSCKETTTIANDEDVKGRQLLDRPCDEIYVVGEGETLHSISDKCGDPFIVEQNPHIHDPDDVFPGLVIKITPMKSRKSLSFPHQWKNRNILVRT
ncbi:LysM domain - like 1 [Theobroma cacao]|nr:LysM domain - like 1 [Theobroma cacao]